MKCLCAQLPWASTKIPRWLLYCLSLSSCSEWNISVQKVIYRGFWKITESFIRDTVGQNGLFWMVQKEQCAKPVHPKAQKNIRSELSGFCKMLVDIEACTRNGKKSMCGRVDLKIRAWKQAFTTSVFPALPSIHLSYPYLIFVIFGLLPLVAVLTNISYVHILRCNIC